MENNEQKKDKPVFKVSPGLNQSVELKFTQAKEVRSGESQYGGWYMWFVEVKDATVTFGKGADSRQESGYTGEAIVFLKDSLQTKVTNLIAGEEGVTLNVMKEAKENSQGSIYGEFKVTKVSGGVVSTDASSSLTPSEIELINDMKAFLELGYSLDENVLLGMSGETKYKDKGITLDRIKELSEKAITLYNNKVKS